MMKSSVLAALFSLSIHMRQTSAQNILSSCTTGHDVFLAPCFLHIEGKSKQHIMTDERYMHMGAKKEIFMFLL